ncbi:hypothetical protein ANO14919_088680 [Xylariales sp. No.14919]|nr:hypothetical protein ANO14919_088680 [Xylariales sp. No.14919]
MIIELDGLIYTRFLDAINDAREALMEERNPVGEGLAGESTY